MPRVSDFTDATKSEAVRMLDEHTAKEVAEKYDISVPTVYNWKRAAEGKPRKAAAKNGKHKNGKNGHHEADVLPFESVTANASPVATLVNGSLADSVRALELENAKLRAALAKVRTMFAEVG